MGVSGLLRTTLRQGSRLVRVRQTCCSQIAILRQREPVELRQTGRTATVLRDGGWFGGIPKPPPKNTVPPSDCLLDILPKEDISESEEAFEKNGFSSPGSYYLKHKANPSWNLRNVKYNTVLKMPVLFVEARFNTGANTWLNPKFAEQKKSLCQNLAWGTIDASQWVPSEKRQETDAAIARWLVEDVPSYWPAPSVSTR
ncbi:hypothetical protein LTR84_009423 [Exophiala bonariae]|uniref:Uncharacterized protein n=1 Tax=Exophiala bonariae TaxID=1690606 RepID=A0AAV9MY94_9EURO|nr:hypothetical protein LTR84_009423 [Exophiala bonariae]